MTNRNLGLALAWVRRTGTAADSAVPDADLLARFLTHGDAAAFELLVWRHQRLVLGVCMRVLRDVHDAEDAFQAAFLVLARKAHTIARRENLAAWLYRVAYRCALTARAARARRMRREHSLGAADDFAEPDQSAHPAEQREMWAILDEELSRLPERFRTPAILCYFAGKTVDQAAVQLGCPRGTVASRLARARERLRIRLAARGVTLPAGLTTLALTSAGSADAAPALIASTIHVIKLQAAGGAISANAAVLAERVLRAMFLRKFLVGAAVLAALTVVVVAGGLLSLQVAAQPAAVQQPDAQKVAPEKPAQPPVERVEKAAPAAFQDFTGQLDCSQEIEIGSRVAGQLDKVHVKEGADVKKGDLLFEVESSGARLEVERALAELARAEAGLKAAAGDLERAKALLKNRAISQEEFDKPARAAGGAAASFKVAQISLDRARLILDSYRIHAPIAGRIARVFVNAGNLVQADGAKPLAALVVVDPIALRFNIDERTFLRYQKVKQAGMDKAIEVHFAIIAADDKGYPNKATLATVRQSVDPVTGILVGASVANPERLLLPGMAVRVRLTFPSK